MSEPHPKNASSASGKHPRRAGEKTGRSLSMHEGKAIWCDCCSCEAEERWAELAEEMGIDLSDEAPEGDEPSG